MGQVEKRLKDLEALKHGWFDGTSGEVLPAHGLEWLRDTILGLMVETRVPKPRLYPCLDGSVEAEWSFGAWEVSATIDLLTRQAILHAANMDSLEEQDKHVSLEDVRDFCDFIQKYQALPVLHRDAIRPIDRKSVV